MCYNALTADQGLGFQSVYYLANNGKEPEYTTWKLRTTGVARHVLDYIFLKNAPFLNVSSFLSIPKPIQQEYITIYKI